MTYILTLQLDPTAQTHFNRLRQQHFPPALNYIDAHVTLFHLLPEQPSIREELASTASTTARFTLTATGLRSLGKGVAYTFASPVLLALHRHLATAFADDLSPQDHQKFQPHIVIQNKVTPEAAKLLLYELQTTFIPMQIQATGLTLWHYRNGPWEHAQTLPFLQPPTTLSS